jgi:hypothetical protein
MFTENYIQDPYNITSSSVTICSKYYCAAVQFIVVVPMGSHPVAQ